jgi:hypothetical protein
MPTQIRPNRLEVSDRFPMLGFTVRTDGAARRFEIAIGTSPDLFGPEGKNHRSRSNFYSTRAAGPLPIERGEAVYVLPPEILARFVGQQRLYFGLATAENGAGKIEVVTMPTAGSPYISIGGLTGRSLQRVRLLPNRQRLASNYGKAGSEMDWAGDAPAPGTQPMAPPTGKNGAAKEAASPGAPFHYDDGYGPLPPPSLAPAAEPKPQPQLAKGSAFGDGQQFDENWNDVEVIGQPENYSCWATAASMVVGWRDRVSLDIQALRKMFTDKTGVASDTGLYVYDDRKLAEALGLVAEPPQCYTVDSFRQILENYGPLWAGIHTEDGWGHAVVVTGLYGDGTPDNTYVRIHDPWGRSPGTPTRPGSHNPTPGQGSRYTLSFSEFEKEYEDQASSSAGTVNVQILHATDTDGRTIGMGADQTYALATAAGIQPMLAREGKPGGDDWRKHRSHPAGGTQRAAQAQTPTAQALDSDLQPVHLPRAERLTGWKRTVVRTAVEAAVTEAIPPVSLVLPALIELANSKGFSVGFGLGGDAGLLGGVGIGFGVILAPNDDVGVFGSLEINAGLLAGISGGTRVIVIRGGIEAFNETGYGLGVTVEDGPSVSAIALFDGDKNFHGVSFQLGIGAALSPIQIFTGVEKKVSKALTQSLARDDEDSLHGGKSGAYNWKKDHHHLRGGKHKGNTQGVVAQPPKPEVKSLSDDIPLDPGVGGQSIGMGALQIGDIIVSTTDHVSSRLIRVGTGSQISHAMLYVGQGGQVVQAVGAGVQLIPLEDAIANATVAVAFRVPELTDDQRQIVADKVASYIGQNYDYVGIVRQAMFQIHRRVCSVLPGDARQNCENWYGRIDLGRGDSTDFFCSELVIKAFADAGITLTSRPPNWNSPQDIVDLYFKDGALAYVGHLKAPVASKSLLEIFGMSMAAAVAQSPASGSPVYHERRRKQLADASTLADDDSFTFSMQCGESINDRVVRCCREALQRGPMGEKDRHDFYRNFISAGQEESDAAAERLTHVRTSCAMFVRAVRIFCGATPPGPYKPGTGMFVSMGNVSFQHPAFVPLRGDATPNRGDYFYISSTKASNDGHTGIFLSQDDDGSWQTAEGGGGDGTVCKFGRRQIVGDRFNNDRRTLWGWFDCTKVGLAESDACQTDWKEQSLAVVNDHDHGMDGTSATYDSPPQNRSVSVRLPAAPKPKRTAEGRAFDAAPRMIANSPITTVTGEEGNVTWALDQFPGVKVASASAVAPLQSAETIHLANWPYCEHANGGPAWAWFTVDWKFSGQALGQIRITPSGVQPGPYPLRVEARVEDDKNRDASTVSLAVHFTYHFATAEGPEAVATTDLILYSDGSIDQKSDWVSQAAA